MFNISLNCREKSADLLPVNKDINKLLKRIDIAQHVSSWTSQKALQAFYAVTIATIILPISMLPTLLVGTTYLVAEVIFRVLSSYEKNLLIEKKQIYKKHSFLNLNKLHLECSNSPIQIKFKCKNKVQVESNKLKNLPTEIQSFIIQYRKGCKEIEKEVKRTQSEFYEERLSSSIDLGSLDRHHHSTLKSDLEKLNRRLNEETSKKKEQLYSDFYLKCTNEVYPLYINSHKQLQDKTRLLNQQEYSEKIKLLIGKLKKVKMIVSFQELITKPFQVETDVIWMEKNLRYKHFKQSH